MNNEVKIGCRKVRAFRSLELFKGATFVALYIRKNRLPAFAHSCSDTVVFPLCTSARLSVDARNGLLGGLRTRGTRRVCASARLCT